MVQPVPEIEAIEPSGRPGPRFIQRGSGDAERELHVLDRGERRQETVGLEDDAHLGPPDGEELVACEPIERRVPPPNLTLVGRVEARQHPEERGLARSARTHQEREVPRPELERGVADRGDLHRPRIGPRDPERLQQRSRITHGHAPAGVG